MMLQTNCREAARVASEMISSSQSEFKTLIRMLRKKKDHFLFGNLRVTQSTLIVRRWSRSPLPPVLNLNLPRCRQCVGMLCNSIIQSASFSVRFLSYIQTGCTSLKLVMKHFWTLISDTLKATPSVGVDITREER